jgi:hypothetical protein
VLPPEGVADAGPDFDTGEIGEEEGGAGCCAGGGASFRGDGGEECRKEDGV